jgi:hypothetical protein
LGDKTAGAHGVHGLRPVCATPLGKSGKGENQIVCKSAQLHTNFEKYERIHLQYLLPR